MKQKKIIFFYSQSPRSGHNFVADVIRLMLKCTTPIGDRSEIPLAGIIRAYQKAKKKYYKSEGGEEYLDNLFLNDLRNRILNSSSNVLVKNTSFFGADESFALFPSDFHIISFRDPKDCVISLFKGMKLKKGIKSTIKRIIMPFGVYHFIYARAYNKRISNSLPELDDFFIVRYEELVFKNRNTLNQLICFFNVQISVEDLAKLMDDIKVINTSFFKEETQSDKLWQASVKTVNFNPVNREKGFNKMQLMGIKMGLISLRRKMGYIK